MHRPRIDIGSWGDIIQEGFIYDRKTFECAEKTDIKMAKSIEEGGYLTLK